MALSANTNVASTVANYFSDNYTALLQAGTAVPPSYTAPASQAFDAWKTANTGKQFYLEKSGDTYKLGSVSGSDTIPDGAEAIALDVAYAVESKELSLTDWVLARMMDEIRRSTTAGSFSSALSSTPEASLNFDLSSMDQSDLEQLLKRLEQVRGDLQTAMALGNASDKQSGLATLGLAATQLGEAIAQQALFQEAAASLSEAQDARSAQTAAEDAQVSLEVAQGALPGAQSTLEAATGTRDAAIGGRDAAQTTMDEKAQLLDDAAQALQTAQAGEIEQLQAAYNLALTQADQAQTTLSQMQSELDAAEAARTQAVAGVDTAQTAVTNAEAAVAAAEATLTQTQSALDAADNFNAVVSEAYAQLVAGLTSELAAAQLAYSQTASSTASSAQLGELVGAAGGALNSRLARAADLALLGNPALSLFSALDVQETDDGYVLDTSNKSARDTQRAAVRAALEDALSDPALQTALADAMAANADSLGTADADLPSQMQLYNEVAAAVIAAMRGNDAYLDKLADGAVDFVAGLDQSVGNDLLSQSRRDSVLTSAMN